MTLILGHNPLGAGAGAGGAAAGGMPAGMPPGAGRGQRPPPGSI